MVLDDAQAAALARTKAVHVALVVPAVVGGVVLTERAGSFSVVFLCSFGALSLGGVVQSCTINATAGQKCKRAARVAIVSAVGLVAYSGLFYVAYGKN